jgi:hypothetical protein
MLPSQERVTLKLKAGDTVTLAEELATDTTVRYLTLTGNCGDAGAAALGAALKTNNTLRSLVLSSNKIKLKGVIGLAEGLAENRGLMLLDLGNNAIGDAGGVKVAAALAVNKSLISLCVALCELEAESAGAASDGVAVPVPGLGRGAGCGPALCGNPQGPILAGCWAGWRPKFVPRAGSGQRGSAGPARALFRSSRGPSARARGRRAVLAGWKIRVWCVFGRGHARRVRRAHAVRALTDLVHRTRGACWRGAHGSLCGD